MCWKYKMKRVEEQKPSKPIPYYDLDFQEEIESQGYRNRSFFNMMLGPPSIDNLNEICFLCMRRKSNLVVVVRILVLGKVWIWNIIQLNEGCSYPSFKLNLKAVLLHNGSCLRSIPVVHAHDGDLCKHDGTSWLKQIFWTKWKICGDLKICAEILGMQWWYTRFCCFLCRSFLPTIHIMLKSIRNFDQAMNREGQTIKWLEGEIS